jgi:hypothetical protein
MFDAGYLEGKRTSVFLLNWRSSSRLFLADVTLVGLGATIAEDTTVNKKKEIMSLRILRTKIIKASNVRSA